MYKANELIEKEVVRRIIDSPRTKKQMLDMLESIEPIIQNQEEWTEYAIMTNAEAKEIVKRIKGYMGDGECWSESEFMAMDKAIKALEALEDMPTMVYPQVDGITPTVVMPSEVNTIIQNQEEMDRLIHKDVR